LTTENPTFQDLLSVMGAHRSRLTITPEEFSAILRDLQARFATEYFEAVLVGIEHIPAKRGQRGLRWYDHIVESLIEVAGVLGISVSTDARSSSCPPGGPAFVFRSAASITILLGSPPRLSPTTGPT
jgi:hypothetical protein